MKKTGRSDPAGQSACLVGFDVVLHESRDENPRVQGF